MVNLRFPVDTVRHVMIGDSAAGRTAALLSTVAAGSSFMPGLMPRAPREQAMATGVVSALQYGLVITSHARHRAAARLVAAWTGRSEDPTAVRLLEAAVSSGAALAGLVMVRALPERPDESIERAFARTYGLRAFRMGAASVVVAAADAVEERYGERSRLVRTVAPGVGLLIGSGIAAAFIRSFRKGDPVVATRLRPVCDPLTGQQLRSDDGHEAHTPSVPTSLGMGFGVAIALHLLAGLEGVAARGVGAAVRKVIPGSDPYAHLVGHSVTLGATGALLGTGLEYVYHRAEAGGSAIDAAYTTAPTSTAVSGGPTSGIDWRTLSREGVRFVALALTREEIAAVTGVPLAEVTTPVRGYAGLESGETVGARVDLVMEDLEKLGAFERSVICLASPTGTGYLNHVAVEALEYLTRGDCATVALQYSLRPSFLSLDRVAMAREQNFALLHALVWRIRGLPEGKRPRLVGFGESLGAHTLQNCFLHEGVAGFERVDMDSALFLGTPAGSRWARDWRLRREALDPDGHVLEVASYDEWRAVLASRRAADGKAPAVRPRYVLLSNHEDPITRFTPRLAVQRPDWLGPPDTRPPGVPRKAVWFPYSTLVLTLIDVLNAMDFVPGVFVARGHDYRASLARMVSEAYDLPVSEEEMRRIELALRERERTWAERRLMAEQMHRASEAVNRQLRSWGIDSSPLPEPLRANTG